MNHAVQPLAGRAHLHEHGQRQLLQIHQSRDERIREVRHRIGQRVAHFVGIPFDVAREQRFSDDGEGEAAHFPGDVELRARRDLVAPARGVADEGLGEALHVLAMEQGLNGAALFQMMLPRSGEQPFTQQRLGALEHDALGELARRLHEDVFNPLGPADQVDLLWAELVAGDVAVGARGVGEECERILAERPERASGQPG